MVQNLVSILEPQLRWFMLDFTNSWPVSACFSWVVTASRPRLPSLNAWKTGAVQPQKLIGSKPAIGTVDVQRIGKRLADYQIVGPLAARGTARPFAVRLVFEPQTEPVETRYVVIGQDPLWVFGHADYERILHWEHAMDGQPANPAPQNQPSANPESSHP